MHVHIADGFGLDAYQVRVILWVTSVINTDSSNYAEAVANNYILKVRSSPSSLLDFTRTHHHHPYARARAPHRAC
jgi:hypothetical protein